MKLQPDRVASENLVSGYASGSVQVGDRHWSESLLLPNRGSAIAWGVPRFEDLNASHFEQIVRLGPEIVLFGSGARLRFPNPAWLQSLMVARIGFETMDTAAACRTYNLLIAEGRNVVAALLLEQA